MVSQGVSTGENYKYFSLIWLIDKAMPYTMDIGCDTSCRVIVKIINSIEDNAHRNTENAICNAINSSYIDETQF